MPITTVLLERAAAEPTVGRVTTSLRIVNVIDEGAAARGLIAEDGVRSVELEEVLVDTGATTLCLPADLVRTLGLRPFQERRVMTASGPSVMRLLKDARIYLLGREGTFECLELPEGTPPLIGVIPLEALGLEPDLRNQQLRILPDDGPDNYITAL
jgi:clan AA aspartic protease